MSEQDNNQEAVQGLGDEGGQSQANSEPAGRIEIQDQENQPAGRQESPAQVGHEDAAAGDEPVVAGDSGQPPQEDPIAALQRQRDELEAKMLRVAADYQNFARRSHQNLQTALQQQLIDVTKALLTVLDHFDCALEVDPQTTSPQSLLDGMQIVRDEFLRTLERFGVSRMEAKPGDKFDPNRHEALMRKTVEGLEPDHVAEQLQPGYALEDKTLRPAKVSITE